MNTSSFYWKGFRGEWGKGGGVVLLRLTRCLCCADYAHAHTHTQRKTIKKGKPKWFVVVAPIRRKRMEENKGPHNVGIHTHTHTR